jgi:hypothetical protein
MIPGEIARLKIESPVRKSMHRQYSPEVVEVRKCDDGTMAVIKHYDEKFIRSEVGKKIRSRVYWSAFNERLSVWRCERGVVLRAGKQLVVLKEWMLPYVFEELQHRNLVNAL